MQYSAVHPMKYLESDVIRYKAKIGSGFKFDGHMWRTIFTGCFDS